MLTTPKLHPGQIISAVSAAPSRRRVDFAKPSLPLLYGMNKATMKTLGLYISTPRSAQETDYHFPELALWVVNPQGALHLMDIANAPFLRPNLALLLRGLAFVIEKDNPACGTAV
ncbi:MAG: hypothetical protein KGL63_13110 [Betaproteobacteria bacterium]|nr:hypothetical protein [Betaproteobacteria bacterium]